MTEYDDDDDYDWQDGYGEYGDETGSLGGCDFDSEAEVDPVEEPFTNLARARVPVPSDRLNALDLASVVSRKTTPSLSERLVPWVIDRKENYRPVGGPCLFLVHHVQKDPDFWKAAPGEFVELLILARRSLESVMEPVKFVLCVLRFLPSVFDGFDRLISIPGTLAPPRSFADCFCQWVMWHRVVSRAVDEVMVQPDLQTKSKAQEMNKLQKNLVRMLRLFEERFGSGKMYCGDAYPFSKTCVPTSVGGRSVAQHSFSSARSVLDKFVEKRSAPVDSGEVIHDASKPKPKM